MTQLPRAVPAQTFLAWYKHLEAIVADDPADVAADGSQRAVMLLHELVSIGLRNGALLPVVTHSTGPLGYAHLSFRYPLNREFDWSGELGLMLEPGPDAARLQQLIVELEAATGIAARDDEFEHAKV